MNTSRSPKRRSVARQILPRRTFLRGMATGGAGVCLSLPLLDMMLDSNGTARADDGGSITRFGTFFWGLGILHEDWVPNATGMNWALPPTLAPFGERGLDPYVSMVTNATHRRPGAQVGHIPYRGLSLSASHDPAYVNETSSPGYRGQHHPEPSVDAIVREAWMGTAPLNSLNVQVVQTGHYAGMHSWNRGGSSFNTPTSTPSELFEQVFAGGNLGEPPDVELLEVTTALQKSMLDFVREDTQRLKSRLGANDRRRLDDHLEGIRELEQRLQSLGDGSIVNCDATDPGDGDTMRRRSELTSDLLATALACDVSRVFSYEWSGTQSEFEYGEVGVNGQHHSDISHNLGGRADDMRKILGLIMGGLAYFADALRSMPEAGGNVLDNTLILGTSEHANADRHDATDHPYLFVGGASGGLRAGMHHRYPDSNNNHAPRVLLTAVRAVGVELDALGQPETQDSRGDTMPSRRTSESVSEMLT